MEYNQPHLLRDFVQEIVEKDKAKKKLNKEQEEQLYEQVRSIVNK